MTRPLRVAYLLGSLRPGGAERQMLLLAERLPSDRFSVDFLSMVGPDIWDAQARAAGAKTRALGLPGQPGAPWPSRTWHRARKTARYARDARRFDYDVVDAWLFPADLLAASVRAFTRTPVIISGRRNLQPHDHFGPFSTWVDRFMNARLDAVVANSAAAARVARTAHRVGADKLRIIRNGVRVFDLPSAEQRAASRDVIGVRDDDFVIGCVANYLPVKRHELLIRAFASCAVEDPRLRLVLIGEGPARADMEAQVKALGLTGRVSLHGTERDPIPLYGAFDLVVQASRSEGLPNAVLEAASAGRPIVATDAGGTDEIILDGQTGLLVPIEDETAMARAINTIVTDGHFASRLGASARDHIVQSFGMDRYVREFSDLYEGLAAAKGIRR